MAATFSQPRTGLHRPNASPSIHYSAERSPSRRRTPDKGRRIPPTGEGLGWRGGGGGATAGAKPGKPLTPAPPPSYLWSCVFYRTVRGLGRDGRATCFSIFVRTLTMSSMAPTPRPSSWPNVLRSISYFEGFEWPEEAVACDADLVSGWEVGVDGSAVGGGVGKHSEDSVGHLRDGEADDPVRCGGATGAGTR